MRNDRLTTCERRRYRIGTELAESCMKQDTSDSRFRKLLRSFRTATLHVWAARGDFPVRESCPYFHPPASAANTWLSGCICDGTGRLRPEATHAR